MSGRDHGAPYAPRAMLAEPVHAVQGWRSGWRLRTATRTDWAEVVANWLDEDYALRLVMDNLMTGSHAEARELADLGNPSREQMDWHRSSPYTHGNTIAAD